MANSMENSVAVYQNSLLKSASSPAALQARTQEIGKELPTSTAQVASLSGSGLKVSMMKPSEQKVVEAATDVSDAVARLQDYVQNTQRSLNFSLDESTGITVISVYDASTQELIRQIPSEEAVSLAQKLNQEEPLALFRAQV
ncbi:flagellar protein FlaG [Salinispirillum marinum]|uniref:Flagellar protein FlaG n=2 Tax=Saccharospirillaceae TaxID=255527 RepID=A0ABV8BFC6_9GAMM